MMSKTKRIRLFAMTMALLLILLTVPMHPLSVKAADLTAVAPSLKTQSVGIRYADANGRTEGPLASGLRFCVEVFKRDLILRPYFSASTYAYEADAGVQFGMLLLPEKLLGDQVLTVQTENVLDVPFTKVQSQDTTSISFSVSLLGIPTDKLDERICVRAYARVKSDGAWKYYYENEGVSRVPAHVANQFYLQETTDERVRARLDDLFEGSALYTGKDTQPDEWRLHPEDYKLIAFTFDDAPGANFANSGGKYLVDLFAQYHGSATFFLVGSNLSNNGWALPRYALEHGWDLGNHTNTHCDAKNTSEATADKFAHYRNEIQTLSQRVKAELNYDLFWFRPPNMQTGTNNWIFEVTTALGMPAVGETKYSYDWSANHNAQAVKEAILNGPRNGEIVLLHTENAKTRQVIAEVLETLYQDGFRFCTLSELFTYQGYDLHELPTDRVIKSTFSVQ